MRIARHCGWHDLSLELNADVFGNNNSVKLKTLFNTVVFLKFGAVNTLDQGCHQQYAACLVPQTLELLGAIQDIHSQTAVRVLHLARALYDEKGNKE